MQEPKQVLAMSSCVRLKVLGRGSFGDVFLAKPINPIRNYNNNQNLDYVALKVASIQDSFSLFNEKYALQHFIGCPEIIQCIGSELTMEEGDFSVSISYNLILEYAPGGTLADLIKQHKKLPEKDVKEYLRMMLRGLSCIHGRGFVHSDLKPANILVFPQEDGNKLVNKLKIGDFGIAKRCEDREGKSSKPKVRGTLRYLSPEAIGCSEINTPLDIWSLGCILIDMISGKQAWDSCKNQIQLMSKLVFGTEIPEIPEELSEQGKDFLRKCFDRDSTRRWTADMLLRHAYLSS